MASPEIGTTAPARGLRPATRMNVLYQLFSSILLERLISWQLIRKSYHFAGVSSARKMFVHAIVTPRRTKPISTRSG